MMGATRIVFLRRVLIVLAIIAALVVASRVEIIKFGSFFTVGILFIFIPTIVLLLVNLIVAALACLSFRRQKLVLVGLVALFLLQSTVLFLWTVGLTAASAFRKFSDVGR